MKENLGTSVFGILCKFTKRLQKKRYLERMESTWLNLENVCPCEI